ncbi:hypothetical protein N7481_010271 [Penicillium waksmanii]|uniref:uncharacterized protein n=1 Tax=Penicillium waksmanii TaxID=69791 RepID=UPI002548556C|nr:uncharacterized protein N7481_010271 [Penicillium waksmanii]KAJ5976564.1 hypothetical protein N7481_010271 [Penicillium waksmanii]
MSLNDTGSALDSELPLPVTYIVSSFLSVAIYNVVELTFTLFLTFKRRNGLYFWSFLVATWGIAIYSIGFILKDFNLAKSISYFYVTLIIAGWCMMVTGQSMVLYSRLHLIVHSHIILWLVLGMIIIDAIMLHIPTIILCYGSNSPLFVRFSVPYAVYERVQVSIFFVQEVIISGLYVYETNKMLHIEEPISEIHDNAGKRLLLHLVFISITVVVLDICILVLEFAGRYASQTAVKGFIYSVKLKLEFNILNRLVEFVQRPSNPNSDLIYGSGSRHYLNTRQEEQDTNGVRHNRCRYSLVLFGRKVQHELGISAEKYVWRVLHITQRRGVVQECVDSGSIMEPETMIPNLGNQPADDYRLRGQAAE